MTSAQHQQLMTAIVTAGFIASPNCSGDLAAIVKNALVVVGMIRQTVREDPLR